MIADRLDAEIECGAKARPKFSTEIVTTDGGWEVRNSRWRYPLHQFEFNLEPNPRDEADFLEFRDLFYAAGGCDETFLFRHWADDEGVNELMEAVEGSTTVFQLMKNYTRGATTRRRKITRPVAGTVAIYVNAVEQLSGFTVDYETGQVTFLVDPIAVPRADFEFDIPVRFADDEIEFVGLTDRLEQPVSIVLIEVKE